MSWKCCRELQETWRGNDTEKPRLQLKQITLQGSVVSVILMPESCGVLMQGKTSITPSNVIACSRYVYRTCDILPILFVFLTTVLNFRGGCFCTLPIPGDCSWSWRKILQLRAQFRTLIRYRIELSSQVFFWQDPWLWLPVGPLIEHLQHGREIFPCNTWCC